MVLLDCLWSFLTSSCTAFYKTAKMRNYSKANFILTPSKPKYGQILPLFSILQCIQIFKPLDVGDLVGTKLTAPSPVVVVLTPIRVVVAVLGTTVLL